MTMIVIFRVPRRFRKNKIGGSNWEGRGPYNAFCDFASLYIGFIKENAKNCKKIVFFSFHGQNMRLMKAYF